MQSLLNKLPPSFAALLLQLVSFLLASLCINFTNVQASSLIFAVLCGIFAATLSYFCGLARWWLAIQFLFAPAIVLVLQLHLPSEVFLAAFLVMLVVYWSTFRSQVPLYLSSNRVWKTLEELLPPIETGKNFSFMDVGSGLGGVLTHLATVRPDGIYFGIENAPLPYLISKFRIQSTQHPNCHVQWGSMWSCNLAPYDIVFAYLSPVPMDQLWQKVKQEMRPGSLFISNSFAVPQHPPQYSITLDDMHHSTLHIWHM